MFGRCAGLLMAASLYTQPTQAQLVISMDMDTATLGIQSTRIASPGDIFDVELVFDLTGQPAGVASYGVSVQFNNTELMLNGSPAATAYLPAGFGFSHFSATGVGAESNDIGGGLGQVSTFEATTFGLGPTSGTMPVGKISFKVLSPVLFAGADVTPGLFNTGVDGLFDNSSTSIGAVTFNSGSVVPEPSALALTTSGLLLAGVLIRRLRR